MLERFVLRWNDGRPQRKCARCPACARLRLVEMPRHRYRSNRRAHGAWAAAAVPVASMEEPPPAVLMDSNPGVEEMHALARIRQACQICVQQVDEAVHAFEQSFVPGTPVHFVLGDDVVQVCHANEDPEEIATEYDAAFPTPRPARTDYLWGDCDFEHDDDHDLLEMELAAAEGGKRIPAFTPSTCGSSGFTGTVASSPGEECDVAVPPGVGPERVQPSDSRTKKPTAAALMESAESFMQKGATSGVFEFVADSICEASGVVVPDVVESAKTVMSQGATSVVCEVAAAAPCEVRGVVVPDVAENAKSFMKKGATPDDIEFAVAAPCEVSGVVIPVVEESTKSFMEKGAIPGVGEFAEAALSELSGVVIPAVVENFQSFMENGATHEVVYRAVDSPSEVSGVDAPERSEQFAPWFEEDPTVSAGAESELANDTDVKALTAQYCALLFGDEYCGDDEEDSDATLVSGLEVLEMLRAAAAARGLSLK